MSGRKSVGMSHRRDIATRSRHRDNTRSLRPRTYHQWLWLHECGLAAQ
ncbi:hypothetical protein EM595_2943 [Duffyella gerundensis]|uniref:Uncharacterized protein n=1 Tax=Duffyella gerundensis TaxID=1619313 RepID=A0A0U5L8U9_9GAMM|nr:hypothetical protein EM595_2943 [Duffyella gerundensis]